MAIKFSRETLQSLTKGRDFIQSSKFGIEIDGVTVGGCHRLSDIKLEAEVIEYCEGDDKVTHARPGKLKAHPFTIERDFSSTKELFEWRKKVIEAGEDYRKSVSLIFQNDKGDEAKRLNLFNCHNIKWSGPRLDSKSSGHSTECSDIVFEDAKMG